MRANTSFQNTLGLKLFTSDQCEELHLASLEVLDSVGVKVHEKEALDLLRSAGARIDGNLVRIPAWMVQEALATAPCRIPIGNRQGERVMLLERGRIYFGTGSDTQNTIDIYNGSRRATVKQDVINAARVADSLPNIDFVMSLGIASDVPTMTSFVHQFEAMVLNTVKPIVYTADSSKDVADIIEMAEIVAGGPEALKANPFMILYAEPSSPLQHSETAIQKLLLCAQQRLPVMYIPTVMLGASGPVTSAGALIIANAEILSGLVIHQLKAKGAPFIYGGSAPPMDMKTAICSYGAPEAILNDAAMITLSQYYNLPVFCTAGCSDAQVFDQQAGQEAAFSMLLLGLAGGNLIHDLGYIGAGMTSSMEMLVLCNETASMVRHVLKGIEISPVTKALEVIKSAGPGGSFLTEDHTLENFKNHLHFSELLNRFDYDRWKEAGSADFGARANTKIREILEKHHAGSLPPDVVKVVQAVTARRES